jgi:hypothetical protein
MLNLQSNPGGTSMHKFKISPLARAVGVVGSVTALATGVTFAALSSQATLTDNTISTASASLLVWNGSDFVSSAPGFTITDLVPGTGVTKTAYFKNAGGTPVKITAHVPTLPGAPSGSGGDYGFSGFDNLTVDVTGEECGDTVSTTLAALNSSEVTLPCTMDAGDQGNAGSNSASGNYDFKFDINPNAINGSQAGVGPFDLVFTATAAAPVESTTPVTP